MSEAAAEHGAYRVSAELHLDYAELERRAARVAGTPGTAALAPRFVELFAPDGAVQTTPTVLRRNRREQCPRRTRSK